MFVLAAMDLLAAGVTISDTAAVLGVSPFTLRRQLDRWLEDNDITR